MTCVFEKISCDLCVWEDLLRLVCLGRSFVTCVSGKTSCDLCVWEDSL